MAIEVLINAGAGEIRVALMADGKLEELSFERTLGLGNEIGGRGCHSLIGNIVLGRVQRVMVGMQAAFVEIGQHSAGFLALREARSLAGTGCADPGISDCVREGDAVLVQVIKDPIGDKGARLSAGVTLPGRLLVMTPNQPGIMLSRRIEDEAARRALTALGDALLKADGVCPGAGYIFRTAALGATLEELTRDALGLSAVWRDVVEKRKSAKPPALLYQDLGPVERTLRDTVRGDIIRVLIDDAGAAEAARAYCRRAMPEAEKLIEYSPENVFARFNLEDEIAGLAIPKVQLPSGAWITIETTEALTAIDVNSGRFTQSESLEQTSFAVNLECAAEIGRQIRLRGIGGLIVVDFIHLSDPDNSAQVVAALEKSLGFDRAPVQVSPMAEFGIVAITRKRVREPLARLIAVDCLHCFGTGHAPSCESVALDILRSIEREARAAPGKEILCEAAPDVTEWLTDRETEIRSALARRGAGRVRFAAGNFERDSYDIRPI